jgi:hypothetical protein
MKRGNEGRSRVQQWLVGGAGLGLLMALGFGGCSLERGGTIPKDCTADAQCDDENPCTIDVCDDRGLCGHTPDDDIVLEQKPYDCQYALCEGGVPIVTPDPKDFDDDGESCTVDSCEGTTVKHTPVSDGTKCTSGGNTGTCLEGTCKVECTAANAATACDDKNPCTIDSCDAGTGFCLHDPQDGIGLPETEQVAGDCQVKVCQLGKVADIHDNADVPVDQNPCTADICTEGMPSNPNQPIDFGCSKDGDEFAKVCDGDGGCVQCNQPEQCAHLPLNDDCQVRTCSAGKCGQDFTAVETPVSAGAQTPGDCKKTVCDGTGGKKDNVDDADLPNDNNDCTKNVCTNGAPSNPAEPLDTKCGAGGLLVCDGNKVCVGCNSDSQCAPDTFCQDNFCDLATKTCKANNKANNTPLPAQDQIVGDCKQRQCNGTGGIKTVNSNGDLPNDNNPCTRNVCTNGVPSHPLEAINTACTLGNDPSAKVCNATGTCVECTNAGTHCPAAGDCKSPSCSAAGKCGVVNDADLSACDSQTAGDCQTKQCDGMGNCSKTANANDVGSDNIGCTSDSCVNGSNVYTPIGAGSTAAGTCDANNGCNGKPCACDGLGLATSCKTQTGNVCANGTTCVTGFCVDGMCCNSVCNGACSACSAAAGNTVNGTCGPAKSTKVCRPAASACDVDDVCDGLVQTCGNDLFKAAGTNCGDTGTECRNQDTCDGMGACTDNGFKAVGTSCGDAGTECRNQDTCNGTGTCTDNGFKAVGTTCGDAGTECTNQDTCNGMGACTDNGFKLMGTVCGSPDLCEIKGCNGAGTCMSDGAKMAGTVCRGAMGSCDLQEVCNGNDLTCPVDAVVGNGMMGMCMAASEACDGTAKTCKLVTGQPCTADNQCVSGMCNMGTNVCK